MRHVFVIDRRLSSGGRFDVGWGRFAREYAERVDGYNFFVDSSWSIEEIIDEIVRFADAQGIGDLHICCHGRHSGNRILIQLGGGDGLTAANAVLFRQLRDHWQSPNCRIRMHVCFAASVTPGARRSETRQDLDRLALFVNFYLGRPGRGRSGTRGNNAVAPGDPILQAVANHAGIMVQAGLDEQMPDAMFIIEGRTIRYPSLAPIDPR